MNNNYYRENTYNGNYIPQQSLIQQIEKKTINDTESFLKANIGKSIKVYMSFPDSIEWRDKVFEGTLESVGIDYILINDINLSPLLIQKIYVNFIEFKDKANY